MNKEKKNLLVFGYGLAAIISIFTIRHGVKNGFDLVKYLWLAFAFGLTLATAINVAFIKPLYNKWMVVAHFIGRTISTIILALLFYFVFSPVGLIMRLFRIDLLDQKLEPKKESYWIKRDIKPFEKRHYERQF